jgi:hypothetical protein
MLLVPSDCTADGTFATQEVARGAEIGLSPALQVFVQGLNAVLHHGVWSCNLGGVDWEVFVRWCV